MNGSVLDLFAKNGSLVAKDVSPWQTFSGKGMKFRLQSFDWDGCACISHLTMRAFLGTMRMETVICTPYAKDLPIFSYDFIKSVTVKSGQLPDIEYCWEKKMGICQDLSAMTCAMLRSQGVPARLIIGTLGSGTPHAWVLAVVDGEDTFFDPTAELNATNKTDTYTTERWY